jgi:hypothetical protein
MSRAAAVRLSMMLDRSLCVNTRPEQSITADLVHDRTCGQPKSRCYC